MMKQEGEKAVEQSEIAPVPVATESVKMQVKLVRMMKELW